MAAGTIIGNKVVYAAFNSVFRGETAKMRKPLPIKKLVDKHEKQPQVAQLLQKYGAPAIHERLQKLLSDGVFESTVKAQCMFPELFEVSPAQSADSTVSEAEAAADHAKAVEKDIAADGRPDPTCDSDYDSGESGAEQQNTALIRLPTKQEIAPPILDVPSLLPLQFPFNTGYRILVKTQEVLELACFRYAEKAAPEILQDQNWHCPESAELNLWINELSKLLKDFKELCPGDLSTSMQFEELFASIKQIRHHAVHRIPVTAKKLEKFMVDGEALAIFLEDGVAISAMSRAKREVQRAVAEMENKKSLLNAKLSKTLQRIADQRAELDRLEREATVDIQREDGEYQLSAGAHLQQTIWSDDGAVEEALSPTEDTAANERFKDGLVDGSETAAVSDLVVPGDSRAEDAVEIEPIASAEEGSSHGEPDGSRLSTQAEEDPTKSLGPADAGGDGLAADQRELVSESLKDINGPKSEELWWSLMHLF